MQKIKHLLEAALLYALYGGLKVLPLDMASFLAGFLARTVGPHLSAQRTAQRNLDMIFPDWPAEKKQKTLNDMWDNLGRVAAELSHQGGKTLHERVRVTGTEHIPTNGQPAIFFSGHLGNWELTYPTIRRHGTNPTILYRSANNPYADRLIVKLRRTQSEDSIPKGPKGAIRLGRAMKNRKTLAMLIDQKMNEGIPIPFFGRDAMTAPAIAEFALRYGLPLIPMRVMRTQGCHFEARIFPPLQYEKTGDHEKDVAAIMTQINRVIEDWVREYPGQWFWVHKRWPR